MNKKIENITEELIMRYVEGDLDLEESEKFQRILSQNEYLNNRVSILKSIADNQPLKSPSRKVHNKILSDIGLSHDSNSLYLKKYFDSFISFFNRRAAFAVSFLSILLIAISSVFIIGNNVESGDDKSDHITDEPVDKEKEKSSEDNVSI